jgi:hypothetical protein
MELVRRAVARAFLRAGELRQALLVQHLKVDFREVDWPETGARHRVGDVRARIREQDAPASDATSGSICSPGTLRISKLPCYFNSQERDPTCAVCGTGDRHFEDALDGAVIDSETGSMNSACFSGCLIDSSEAAIGFGMGHVVLKFE